MRNQVIVAVCSLLGIHGQLTSTVVSPRRWTRLIEAEGTSVTVDRRLICGIPEKGPISRWREAVSTQFAVSTYILAVRTYRRLGLWVITVLRAVTCQRHQDKYGCL